MSLYGDADVQRAVDAIDKHREWSENWASDTALCIATDVLPAVARHIAAKALRETIAETVCCDEYEAFKKTRLRPKYPHHICYWGAAHAEALRDRADEIERTTP